ncbi:L-2-hydroxyglutarate oxidase [Burkholderia pseudomallei]|uniref:L-2-hydroxyglutarate oxidase n=1 Tax=Burkholderia pseudomallei TaxID=28450 RepID=UPI00048D3DED|nr:L-2-hydroxyglutarate oxidase [Burkholderia pseudomallei]AJX96274.1 FAD dependent oxidoreductase family protein [Burkholderia pseudomallei PB08298010]
MRYDFCVIGGGIVGLATSLQLLAARPGASLVLVEKETNVGRHQTGHNSGVIHAGVYYAPGSLKARLCREGADATKQFCRDHGLPYQDCGKLLVATNQLEMERMSALESRIAENGIDCARLSRHELLEMEPNIEGLGALHVPASAIVDYVEICRTMARLLDDAGATLLLGQRVQFIKERANSVEIRTDQGATIEAQHLVACAGLQSDRVASMAGLDIEHQIVPFRGEYFKLPASRHDLVQRLIYPIPNPDLPFLGVHMTPHIDGTISVGPNAVLGFAREGYPKFSLNWSDVRDMLGFGGFWRVMHAHWRSGIDEFHSSLRRSRYLRLCQKYCPDLRVDDLLPCEPGIRAQAVLRDGTLVHDFLFLQTTRMLHVCNAPSPAATSAIPIGKMIVERLLGDSASR